MPVVSFTVTWPDGTTESCSSPSRAITEHLQAGEYNIADFAHAAQAGLSEASARVERKFGFACSAAAEQWDRLSCLINTMDASAIVSVSYP